MGRNPPDGLTNVAGGYTENAAQFHFAVYAPAFHCFARRFPCDSAVCAAGEAAEQALPEPEKAEPAAPDSRD